MPARRGSVHSCNSELQADNLSVTGMRQGKIFFTASTISVPGMIMHTGNTPCNNDQAGIYTLNNAGTLEKRSLPYTPGDGVYMSTEGVLYALTYPNQAI